MLFHCRRLLPLMNSREYIRKSLKPSDSDELVNELCEMHKPVMSDHIVIPEFHEPLSCVKLFNKVFPLPPKLFRQWKNGVTIKCQTRSVIHEKAWLDTEDEIASTQALLKANIIEHASNGPFMAHLFNIPKAPDTVRPIVNLSRLSECMETPPMVLESLFQLVARTHSSEGWVNNLWYVKFDFSQAFFNVPIERRSRKFLAFGVGNQYFRFRVLPFGLGIAPFVCQTFLDSIISYIRKWTPYAYGFIDDILVGASSRKVLTRIVKNLLLRFKQIKWRLNEKKCVLTPTRKLVFLGSDWHGSGVSREESATSKVKYLLHALGSRGTPLAIKEKQIMAGYLNYYLQFAGKIHTVIQRLVETSGLERDRAEYLSDFLMGQVKIDTIRFRTKSRGILTVYADATPDKMAAIILYDKTIKMEPLKLLAALKRHVFKQDQVDILQLVAKRSLPIIEAEIRALFLALEKLMAHKEYGRYKVHLFTDSMPALYFMTKGSSKYDTWNDATLCELLTWRNRFDTYFDLEVRYVDTKSNPADYYSRT